ncbi:MAG: hypothetical protein VXY74_08275 [SAR324 cluster bacterium]|nr:hypothetical protein [SAR324 cluster bacterium]
MAFLGHLGMIAWNRNLPILIPFMEDLISKNYLSAIYTPFSILLYYEVYLLILAIPNSITKAIGKQFEIISLIIIRDVFKDLSHLGENSFDMAHPEVLYPVLIDMIGALIMFLLVGVFYHLNRNKIGLPELKSLEKFVKFKKVISLLLTLIFLALSVFHFSAWINNLITHDYSTGQQVAETGFYQQLFTVIIFADIFILIISFMYSDSYELTFRNAGYVISTLLIRFGFAVEKPFDLMFFITAIAFGVLLLLIYRYFVKYTQPTNP